MPVWCCSESTHFVWMGTHLKWCLLCARRLCSVVPHLRHRFRSNCAYSRAYWTLRRNLLSVDRSKQHLENYFVARSKVLYMLRRDNRGLFSHHFHSEWIVLWIVAYWLQQVLVLDFRCLTVTTENDKERLADMLKDVLGLEFEWNFY